MRTLSLNDLEVEIVKEIKTWRDEIIKDGNISRMDELDAGDAVKLAGDISLHVIGRGVRITGRLECHRKLDEGWA